jgi:hypothetical protein
MTKVKSMSQSPRFSILSNASNANVVMDPYPHLVIRNALDPDVFAQLAATFPADDLIVNGRQIKDTWYDYPASQVIADERIAPQWRDFFAHHVSRDFYLELVGVLGEAIRQTYPNIEARLGKPLNEAKVGMRPGGKGDPLAPGADLSMECQFYANYTRAPREVRGPHVDRPSEMFAALLYFRQDGDDSTGGDLEVCMARSDSLYPDQNSVTISELPAEIASSSVTTVSTARYAANTLVLFLNSAKSIHAVSGRSPTPLTRRHINFCCDLNFDLFEMRLPPRLKLRKKLETMPVVWRLAKHV